MGEKMPLGYCRYYAHENSGNDTTYCFVGSKKISIDGLIPIIENREIFYNHWSSIRDSGGEEIPKGEYNSIDYFLKHNMHKYTQNNLPSLSVIIPVYNEERTIASIVEIVHSWQPSANIIVVNDGSYDDTLGAIRHFSSDIKKISYKRNHGKGYAVVKGIEAATGQYILMLDGDTIGLTHKDLNLLYNPIISNAFDMVVGIPGGMTHIGEFQPFYDISGFRCLRRKDILPYCKEMRRLGYGLELYLNRLYAKKRVKVFQLPYVHFMRKLEKQTIPEATRSVLIEARDLLTQIVINQKDGVIPDIADAYRQIEKYLQKALEYFT